jgi:hypothetical protein
LPSFVGTPTNSTAQPLSYEGRYVGSRRRYAPLKNMTGSPVRKPGAAGRACPTTPVPGNPTLAGAGSCTRAFCFRPHSSFPPAPCWALCRRTPACRATQPPGGRPWERSPGRGAGPAGSRVAATEDTHGRPCEGGPTGPTENVGGAGRGRYYTLHLRESNPRSGQTAVERGCTDGDVL